MFCRLPVLLLSIGSGFLLPLNGQNRCDLESRLENSNLERLHLTEQAIQKGIRTVQPRSTVVLPVVFHVIHSNASENISERQIRSQIDVLNRDFAFRSENFGKIPPEFLPLGADSGIRFCLASVDPDGIPTNGITRRSTTLDLIGSHQQTNGRTSVHYSVYGGQDAWDQSRYINIWVAGLDGLLGFAALPGMAPFPEEDGIVIDPDFVGAVELGEITHRFDRGHTLTHEIGHYLGLYHIWGMGNGGCANDDMVDDTPEQERAYLGCPDYPQTSCGSSDMFMNFMDFTDDRCLAMFTDGQVQRMMATLNTLRNELADTGDRCTHPGMGDIPLQDVLVYYAPQSRQVIVDFHSPYETQRRISLYASDGRLVKNEEVAEGSVRWVYAESLSAGMYVVEISSSGHRLVRRIIVP